MYRDYTFEDFEIDIPYRLDPDYDAGIVRQSCVIVCMDYLHALSAEIVCRRNRVQVKPLRGQDQLLTMKCPFFQFNCSSDG